MISFKKAFWTALLATTVTHASLAPEPVRAEVADTNFDVPAQDLAIALH